MSNLVKLAYNAVTAKIIADDKEVKNLVSEWLSYYVDGVEHMAAFKGSGWDGRSSFFSRVTSTFPAGFASLVHDKLTANGYRVQMVRAPLPAPLGPEDPIVDEFGNADPRYDYQLQTLRQVERHGRGVVRVATGGGKSKIAKLIIARYRRMTLFLTTRGVLMYQMKDHLESAGMKVGVIGDGIFAPVKGVNVGMVQTLVARLKETTLDAERRSIVEQTIKKGLALSGAEIGKLAQKQFEEKQKDRARTIKLLELFEVVIGEEAHEAGGNSYFEILRHCKNAQIRVALTATPFMRDDAEDNMRLMAAFGPVLIDVPEKLLIDRGILAKPYFKFVSYAPHPKLRRTSPWQRAYQLGIVESPGRNDVVRLYASLAIEHGLSVLVLVQHKKHGAELQKILSKIGKTVFLYGEHKQHERQAVLQRLKDGKIDILIGTTILDVGVDVPALGMLINAGGGKAEVGLRQRVGRVLRAKKKGPNISFVVEFADSNNSHLSDHARQRRAIIDSTPGFAENILGDNEDFDWGQFSKRKAA
jgi:superfamily II DNA or RNA helicase